MHFRLGMILLMLMTLTAWAAPKSSTYQIELLIFTPIQKSDLPSEHWPAVPALTVPADAKELGAPEAAAEHPNTMIPLLSSSHQMLQKEADRLTRSNQYKVLFQGTWIQDLSAQSVPLYWQAGRTFSVNRLPFPELAGLIELRQGRFIQTTLQLVFAAPLNELTPEGNSNRLGLFQLIESRKIQPNELNYFDHPLLGALLKVTPV